MKGIRIFVFFGLLTLVVVYFNGCRRHPAVTPTTCVMVMEKSSTTTELSPDMVELIFGQIEQVISQRPDLRIIDRTRFETVKQELAFQQSDWSNKEKTAEIGKALNADLICFVTIYKSGYKVEFLNVNTVQKITYIGKFGSTLVSDDIKVGNLSGLERLDISKLITRKEVVEEVPAE